MTRASMRSFLRRDRAREIAGMENLETDVMRFMAILGFCLVAVFALVQSLPAADPEPEEIGDIEPAIENDTRSGESPLPAKKDSWPQSVVVEVRDPALPRKAPTAPLSWSSRPNENS